jgi:integrase
VHRALGGMTFHGLRHTGATRMLEEGRVNVKTVKLIGGWRNLKVLDRYLHPSDGAMRAAVNTIGVGLRERPKTD